MAVREMANDLTSLIDAACEGRFVERVDTVRRRERNKPDRFARLQSDNKEIEPGARGLDDQ